MLSMTVPLRGQDVALRLALTVLASLLIGYNRREHGKAAGMRTTLVVCLAASLSMLQVNALLAMAGKQPDSFITNDLMRLPLGILTGVGFIGGGVILHRGGSVVVGVTTAATLWLVTVIGLCLGGGQLVLGMLGTAIGLFALWALRWVEERLRQEQHARLLIELNADGPDELDLRRRITQAGLQIESEALRLDARIHHREIEFEVRRLLNRSQAREPPGLLAELAGEPGVVKLDWRGSA